ncbi:MAG: hypothetical protein ACREL7_19185 [Longimicrobiales bacterium]
MTKEQTDERLTAAQAESGLVDSRASYRARLRALRASDEDAFRRANEHYDREVMPRIASGRGAIDAWIEYGRLLGELTGPGRLVAVDGSGRSRPHEAPYQRGMLVLYMPETGGDVFAVALPLELTAAQRATVGLLVEKRLSIPE